MKFNDGDTVRYIGKSNDYIQNGDIIPNIRILDDSWIVSNYLKGVIVDIKDIRGGINL